MNSSLIVSKHDMTSKLMYRQHKEEEEEMYRNTSLHGDGGAETCRHYRSDLERERWRIVLEA